MEILIPVSVGELLDKISILQIKALITNNEYVHKELCKLNKIKSTITQYTLDCEIELREVNETLWKIEDKLRQKEKKQEFDDEFINLSRSVYKLNDKRSAIKKNINEICFSEYKELKIYN